MKPSAAGQEFIGVPDLDSASGQLVVSFAGGESLTSVSGYIVGKKDVLKLENAGSGKFYISGVPAGVHDLIVTAESQATSLFSLSSQKVGARLSKLEFFPGKRIEQDAIILPELKQVVGRVSLTGVSDAAGVQVDIPGTSYSALSESNGQFQIDDVPVGLHNFFFEKDGFYIGQLEAFELTAQTPAHTLPDVVLMVDTGVEGAMVLGGGGPLSQSRSVSVTLAVPPDALLMKISENENFEGAAWKPLRTSFIHTFDSDGLKTLFAKVANANGLESSLFKATVDVRSQPLTPTLSFVDARCSQSQMKLAIEVSAGAPTPVKMRVSIGALDDSKPWEDFSAEKMVAKTLLSGPITVEVKDAQGNTAQETMHSYDCVLASKEGRSGFASAVSGSKLFIAGGLVPYPYHWSDELNVLDVNSRQLTTFFMVMASLRALPTPHAAPKAPPYLATM